MRTPNFFDYIRGELKFLQKLNKTVGTHAISIQGMIEERINEITKELEQE